MLCVLLWCTAAYRFYEHKHALQPQQMADKIANDLHKREAALGDFLKEKELLQKIFTNKLEGKDIAALQSQPFYLYYYYNDTLSFWNTNIIVDSCNMAEMGSEKLLRTPRGIFIKECIFFPAPDEAKKLVVLIPVEVLFPIENDYLKSHFVAEDYIPARTEVLTDNNTKAGDIQISDLKGAPVFRLRFHAQDIPPWVPDALLVYLLIAAILTSVSWLQLMTIYLTRNKSYVAGFSITLAIIILFRGLTYIYGWPFNLENLPFFSPQLYAHNVVFASLGDLLINTLCLLWLIVFITRHMPYKTFFKRVRSKPLKITITLVLLVAMLEFFFGCVHLITSLVVDSAISFDVSHFYSIDLYTIVGLFTIGIITGVSSLVIYLFNIEINNLVTNKWIKYGLVVLIGFALLITLNRNNPSFHYLLLAWILVFVAMLDIRNFTLVSDLFEPHMVFWALFICGFSTGILQYFNQIKERESRKTFVDQRLSPQHDDMIEANFNKISNDIEVDKVLRGFISKPTLAGRKVVNSHFDAQYLGGQLNKYQSKVYLFDAYGRELFNKDTTNYNTLVSTINEGVPTISAALYYKEYANSHQYLAYMPLTYDTTQEPIGYAILTFDQKKSANESVYPELLQPAGTQSSFNDGKYSYAIYINNKLINQTNDYPFPITIENPYLKAGQFSFYNKNSYSELWYKSDDRRTVVVAYHRNTWLETITLFSYLFGIEILLAIVVLLYQLYISYFVSSGSQTQLRSLTLRRRVHFSMLAVLLLSFLIIGFVTILFFINEYKAVNTRKLQSTMQVVDQSLNKYLGQNLITTNETTFDTLGHATQFKYYITELSASQKADINVYDEDGKLLASSQDDIYDKGLLYPIMRPDAYYQLVNSGRSIVTQDEKVGALSYLASYLPLRDEHGVTFGYINVPFFSSQRDLNYQISSIVVTLINLYAFVFLLSSLFTVFITRRITRTFNVIIRQFSKLNLRKNERISWPYDDEIGLLVAEYNKMVNKVEENAAQLAQSERESAWREMARQVAHEIKNPLTPMKLNIQYLQQALRNGHANVKELADKVSASLVEQIDNLSYIASEFSNFAKMPEAKPERIELEAMMKNVIELYKNDEHIKVQVSSEEGAYNIYADRSQMMRVVNNIMENARQAIPADKPGLIDIDIKKVGEHVVIAITDNGVGISEEVSHRIFQPYFTTKTSGTGLGLAMTKKIIEFWQGEIWFDTEEGKRTTFFISLPIMKD